MSKALAVKALEIATTQLGVSEVPKGSNSGPQVEQYLKSVGLKGGYAWCMAFVYWCANKAAAEIAANANAAVNPLVKTALVMRQWNETTLRKLPKTARNIQPGDIFIMEFGHGTGHTGFVESVKAGYIVTIEGNTNDDGSREGYEVARRERPISSLKGFIQLT
jgi:hypothetical protein